MENPPPPPTQLSSSSATSPLMMMGENYGQKENQYDLASFHLVPRYESAEKFSDESETAPLLGKWRQQRRRLKFAPMTQEKPIYQRRRYPVSPQPDHIENARRIRAAPIHERMKNAAVIIKSRQSASSPSSSSVAEPISRSSSTMTSYINTKTTTTRSECSITATRSSSKTTTRSESESVIKRLIWNLRRLQNIEWSYPSQTISLPLNLNQIGRRRKRSENQACPRNELLHSTRHQSQRQLPLPLVNPETAAADLIPSSNRRTPRTRLSIFLLSLVILQIFLLISTLTAAIFFTRHLARE